MFNRMVMDTFTDRDKKVSFVYFLLKLKIIQTSQLTESIGILNIRIIRPFGRKKHTERA